MEFFSDFREKTDVIDAEKENNAMISHEAQGKFERIMGDENLSKTCTSHEETRKSNLFGNALEKFDAMFIKDLETVFQKDTIDDTSPQYEENETRELFADEKQLLKDTQGWSDEKIEQHCRIDRDGMFHYKCRTEKENDSGVEYTAKVIELNGVKFEVTTPDFKFIYETELSKENYENSNAKQFRECNANLKEAIQISPNLKAKFTSEQISDIENHDTPRGYTWHHNEEPGKMQLVKTEDHDQCIGGAPHTGGNALWGNKARDNQQKGEMF